MGRKGGEEREKEDRENVEGGKREGRGREDVKLEEERGKGRGWRD